jgi:hypothetical protein
MATNDKKTRDHFPVTAKELADFAQRLTYVASRMKNIAEQLPLFEVQELLVTGKPTALRGEQFLVAWMKSLQAALDKAAMGMPSDDEELPRAGTSAAQAMADRAKTAESKKGRPSSESRKGQSAKKE